MCDEIVGSEKVINYRRQFFNVYDDVSNTWWPQYRIGDHSLGASNVSSRDEILLGSLHCSHLITNADHSLDYRPRPVVSRVSTSPPAAIETETKDAMEEEILESVPKTMKTKAELLVRKMKADRNIAWSEKGELKYKEETVRGSNVVDLVNDVLRKRKYFNPQGWETFGEALREANVPQDLIGHEDRWKYITQTKRTPRSRKRQQSPSPIRPYSPKTPRNRRKEVKNWVDF